MTESKMGPPVAAREATAQQSAAEEGEGFRHRPVFHRTVDPSKCHTVFDCHRSITEHFRNGIHRLGFAVSSEQWPPLDGPGLGRHRGVRAVAPAVIT